MALDFVCPKELTGKSVQLGHRARSDCGQAMEGGSERAIADLVDITRATANHTSPPSTLRHASVAVLFAIFDRWLDAPPAHGTRRASVAFVIGQDTSPGWSRARERVTWHCSIDCSRTPAAHRL